jgi:hypothetical protein
LPSRPAAESSSRRRCRRPETSDCRTGASSNVPQDLQLAIAGREGGEDFTFEASSWPISEVGLVRIAGGGGAMKVDFFSEVQIVFSDQL